MLCYVMFSGHTTDQGREGVNAENEFRYTYVYVTIKYHTYLYAVCT